MNPVPPDDLSLPCSWLLDSIIKATAFLTLALAVGAADAPAQEIEPRAFSNIPIGVEFLIAGYGYAEGGLVTDPALPLRNANLRTHTTVSRTPVRWISGASPASSMSSCPIRGSREPQSSPASPATAKPQALAMRACVSRLICTEHRRCRSGSLPPIGRTPSSAPAYSYRYPLVSTMPTSWSILAPTAGSPSRNWAFPRPGDHGRWNWLRRSPFSPTMTTSSAAGPAPRIRSTRCRAALPMALQTGSGWH